jgi:hypothetical protein
MDYPVDTGVIVDSDQKDVNPNERNRTIVLKRRRARREV